MFLHTGGQLQREASLEFVALFCIENWHKQQKGNRSREYQKKGQNSVTLGLKTGVCCVQSSTNHGALRRQTAGEFPCHQESREAAGWLRQAGLGLRRVIRLTGRASDLCESDLRSSTGKGGE